MNTQSLIELQRRATHEHMTSESEKRWTDTYSTYSQTGHAALDAMGIGTRFAGIDAVKGFYEAFHTAFPDFTVTRGCGLRHAGHLCPRGDDLRNTPR